MKHFWALPAVVRLSLVLASQHSFSVHDDLLAFPQYRVGFSDDYLTEAQAQSRLASNNDLPIDQDDAPSEVEHYKPRPFNEHHPEGQDPSKKEPHYQHSRLLLHNQPYLCQIPQIPKPTPDPHHNATTSRAEEQAELARANDRGWELLHTMQDQCIYFVGGWWSYKFCYNQGVKQFHQLPPARGMPMWPPVEDPGVEGYMLGKYEGAGGKGGEGSKGGDGAAEVKTDGKGEVPEEAYEQWEGESALEVSEGAKKVGSSGQAKGELVSRGDTRYLVQKMDGGTMCDLTGKPRRIEVQYHCHPTTSDRISLIKETSTCAYLMVVQTPRLCNDIAFLPPAKDQPNEITCSPILHSDDIPQYELDLAAARSAEKAASLEQAKLEAQALLTGQDPTLPNPEADGELPPQIVGDILIGGHALVPQGHKIEKSAIVGGGKETYIDTVADSDGKLLPKKKMEELGLGDQKAVKKLAESLEKAAGGAKWRLEVIDTPRGREYRGIIGEDEEEEKKGGKKEGKKDGKKDGEGKGKGEGKKGEKKGKESTNGDDGDDDVTLIIDEEAGYMDDNAQDGEEGSQEEYYYKEEL